MSSHFSKHYTLEEARALLPSRPPLAGGAGPLPGTPQNPGQTRRPSHLVGRRRGRPLRQSTGQDARRMQNRFAPFPVPRNPGQRPKPRPAGFPLLARRPRNLPLLGKRRGRHRILARPGLRLRRARASLRTLPASYGSESAFSKTPRIIANACCAAPSGKFTVNWLLAFGRATAWPSEKRMSANFC